MAHMRKCDMSEAIHLCVHYERNSCIRSYGNSDVDMTKTCENYNLAPERESQTGYIKQMLDEIDHAHRKDLIVMGDLIITAPADMERTYLNDFFKEAYEFCIDRYGSKSGLGEDVVISSYVHLDETTPHMHFAFIPVKADVAKETGEILRQRFCAKEVINRQELRTLHKDLQTWLDDRQIPARVVNGNTKYDSAGRSLSVKELKRGGKELKRGRWDSSADVDRRKDKTLGRWE